MEGIIKQALRRYLRGSKWPSIKQCSNWRVHEACYEPWKQCIERGTVVVPAAWPGYVRAGGDINHGPLVIDRPDNGSAYHLDGF